jgi:outer membrane lipoprotein-sorting protein
MLSSVSSPYRRRRSSPAVLAAAAFLLLLLLVSPAAPTEAAQPDVLSPFLDQFTTVSSVHLEAEIVISIEGPDGPLLGSGTFSYWEQGDLFRIRCETEGIPGLMQDVEWGYDGEESLIWLLESNTITENTSLTRETPTALPNPFFLPVEFLSRRSTCPTCRASLDDIVQERPLLTVLDRSRAISGGSSTGGEAEEPRTTLVLAKSETGPRYTVDLAQREGIWAPAAIRQTRPETGEEIVIRLADYRRAHSLVFPQTLTVQTQDVRTGNSAEVTFAIKTLEVNESLSPDTFSIRGNETTHVLRQEEVEEIDF